MKFIRYLILTFVMASMPCGSIQAQNDLNSFGPFEFLKLDNMPQTELEFFNNLVELEKPITALSFDDNLYLLNVISNTWRSLDCTIKFRLEDDFPYDYRQYDYNRLFYFDFSLDYNIKGLIASIGIENLLGFNDATFDIEPVLENRVGVYDEIIFSHESNAIIKLAIAYTF